MMLGSSLCVLVNQDGSHINLVLWSGFFQSRKHIQVILLHKSINSTDCAKLKGYYNKWTEAKYILGCSLFVDLLTPCGIFSKCMQNEVDILGALTSLLKTLKETEKLTSKPLDQWPTYATTLKKCTEEDGHTVYQCQQLWSKKLYYKQYCSSVSQCIKSRLSWSDLQLMRNIIFMLSSHGWEKVIEEESEAELEAIDRLVIRFAVANADTSAIKRVQWHDWICSTVHSTLLPRLSFGLVETFQCPKFSWVV